MYCRHCGKEIDNKVVQCPYCNTVVTPEPPEVKYEESTAIGDSGSNWWGVLGCCLPIVGLILYIVWKEEKPRNAKKAGIGALICVILCGVIPTLLDIVMILVGLIFNLY